MRKAGPLGTAGRRWLVAGAMVLLLRLFFPYLVLLYIVVPFRRYPPGYHFASEFCYAYDGGVGSWVWVVIHALAVLIPVRLYRAGRRWSAALFAWSWLIAGLAFISGVVWIR